jgi:GAF domain
MRSMGPRLQLLSLQDGFAASPPDPGRPAKLLLIHDRFLADLARKARRLTDADGIAIALLTRDNEFICRATDGVIAPSIGALVVSGEGISGQCIASRSSALCGDTAADSRVDAALCGAIGVRSLAVVPLLRRDSAVGLIEAFFSSAGGASATTVRQLEQVADEIVAQLESDAAETLGNSTQPETAPLALPVPGKSETATAAVLGDSTAASVIPGSLPPRRRSWATPLLAALLLLLVAAATFAFLDVTGTWHSAMPLRHAFVPAQVNTAPVAPAATDEAKRSPDQTDARTQDAQGQNNTAQVNRDDGAKSLIRAAERGQVDAQLELAHALATGDGIAQNTADA